MFNLLVKRIVRNVKEGRDLLSKIKALRKRSLFIKYYSESVINDMLWLENNEESFKYYEDVSVINYQHEAESNWLRAEIIKIQDEELKLRELSKKNDSEKNDLLLNINGMTEEEQIDLDVEFKKTGEI
jgi:hypothetical protein